MRGNLFSSSQIRHWFSIFIVVLLAGSLIFGVSGCQHLTFWQKDKKPPQKTEKVEKDPDVELLGAARKQTTDDSDEEGGKKKTTSVFFSSEAKKIDENLGGSRN